MTNRKDDLIRKFSALVEEHGREWQTITNILNQEGITTLSGKQWDANNTRQFYARHCQTPDKQPPEPLPIVTKTFPEWMDDQAQKDLQDMLAWWREKKHDPMREVQTRPVFRGERRNSGFHINKEILDRAIKKVATDKVRTGGSLSKLVELLLWQYIGSPEDLLEKVPENGD